MTRRLVDIDDELLAEVTELLGAATMKEAGAEPGVGASRAPLCTARTDEKVSDLHSKAAGGAAGCAVRSAAGRAAGRAAGGGELWLARGALSKFSPRAHRSLT